MTVAPRGPGRYVYVWADGVYLQARLEESAECMLVLFGTRASSGAFPPPRSGKAIDFAEVVVAPDRSERSGTDVAALTIELGRDIRVRIAATAPAALVTAVIKALALR